MFSVLKMRSFSRIFTILRIVSVLMLSLGSAISYPITKLDADSKVDKAEETYPNGTVVGKYSYTDNEGNPIHVKYYADDGGYGVELKSLKVMVSPSNEAPLGESFKLPIEDDAQKNAATSTEVTADFYNPTSIKYKINDPFEILNKDKLKTNQFKNSKTNPADYEIYFQNEFNAPKKCGKEKVRVYFDKDKRKTREASNELDDTAKICSRF